MSSAPKNSSPDNNAAGNVLRVVPLAVPANRFVVFFALAALGGGIDLWTKHAVFRWRGLPRHDNIWWLIQGRFGIETSVNPGALFGMGAGWWPLFAALSVVALVGIIVWLFVLRAATDRWITVALGFVSGGIVGNLYDRLGLWNTTGLPPELQHGVRDWILFVWPEIKLQIFNPWPNFNIADSLLVTGAVMLVVHAMVWRDDNKEESKKAS